MNIYVTESADDLYKMAEKDIMNVDTLITSQKYPVDQMYGIICFHVTMAVEKFLKGFIITNGKNVEKIHNLDKLHKTATDIDSSFDKIADQCLLLNTYIPDVKYSSKNPLTKQDMDAILSAFKIICNFLPIKALREKFGKMYNYEIVAEIGVVG